MLRGQEIIQSRSQRRTAETRGLLAHLRPLHDAVLQGRELAVSADE